MLIILVPLAVLLLATGICHLAVPSYFDTLVPPWIPRARLVVLGSGLVEIGLAVGLVLPPTRGWAARAVVVLFAGYVAVHVDALVRSRRSSPARWLDRTPAAVARVLTNVGYLALAVVMTSGV